MRFEVPQFIEIEDKIIGPFTWKQFIYIAGGGGAVLVLYFTLPFILFAILGVPIAALAGFLAFHKINNRPFSVFLESMVSYFMGNKLYLWKKKQGQIITAEKTLYKSPVAEAPTSSPVPGNDNISSLARKLEMNALENPTPDQQ
ncbi:PrgI family protein [Candidatus Parcubacteria bacterium]|uniref:PrgI family protein n=1 Tax=Candidatus Kaiserbacteria bacterium CG10_big_fil_rev_8_21_14_0_10_47_16 TaxID=1974608 RepID=A0A2H0UDV4_9BACT|nr:PrgI family protein [Candidatus Parcubacteria bacterium]PIR84608.1 MAG: hypothetical protein COU16_03480 [Candidatus Kaiserbacteria bacterium CG10_big_fil_rev_8_21_14_0_10_47_16]